MTRIQLQIYLDPSSVEVFINLKRNDGTYQRLAAIVDTGAAVSLLPNQLRDLLDHSQQESVTIDQAGIAQQAFVATEATVTLFLEDQTGAHTGDFETQVWFADTDVVLVGFKDILDRAVLHIDMHDTKSGWLEIDI